jgi:hypothetical protein
MSLLNLAVYTNVASSGSSLLAPSLAPILDGTETAWVEANRVVVRALFEPAAWRARLTLTSDYLNFERAYLLN